MGGGLVGDDIDLHAAAHDFGQDVGTVANESDGESAAFVTGRFAEGERLAEIFADGVAIASVDATLDAAPVHVDGQDDSAVESDGQWLSSAHPTHTAGDDEFMLQGPAEVAFG